MTTKRDNAPSRKPLAEERISHRQAAQLLGLKPASLSARYSRNQPAPPRYVMGRNGGRCYYRESDIVAFIEAHRQEREPA